MGGLDPDVLSWAALLAQCTDYARATAALGDGEDDVRWRDATASVIALHAVTFALHRLELVDEEERAFARDRAAVLIREHVGRLGEIWRGVPMPESLLELQDDARTTLERAVYVGAVQLVWSGPGTFVVPEGVADLPTSIERGDEPAMGTLLVMAPGTVVMPGEVVAWWTGRPWPEVGDAFDALDAVDSDAPPQVYRVLDDDGRIVRDLVAPIWCEPLAGMPLLVPLLDEGTPVGRFTMAAGNWEQRQRAVMPADVEETPLPVETRGCDRSGFVTAGPPEDDLGSGSDADPVDGDDRMAGDDHVTGDDHVSAGDRVTGGNGVASGDAFARGRGDGVRNRQR